MKVSKSETYCSVGKKKETEGLQRKIDELINRKEQLENKRLREENKLLKARTKAIEDAADTKAAYENVIKVMRDYAGYGDVEYEY